MTTKPLLRELLTYLASFYPAVDVGPETLAAYESKMRSLNVHDVEKALQRWIDEHDHWPAWSELRPLLRKRAPKSLSEQNPPGWQREIANAKTRDEARAVLDRHAERARSASNPGEGTG